MDFVPFIDSIKLEVFLMQGYYILKTEEMKQNDVFLYFLKYAIVFIIKKAKWHGDFTVALDIDYCGLRQWNYTFTF